MDQEHKKIQSFAGCGFTLLEVVISAGIITLISIIVLARYGSLGSTVGLDNTVRLVAASVRQAQTYTNATREFQPGSDEYPVYGIYVTMTAPDRITLFADRSPVNQRFDGFCPGVECVEEIMLERDFFISDLCFQEPPSLPVCGVAPRMEVVFSETGPASIRWDLPLPIFPQGQIRVSSRRGGEERINIHESGLVEVE
jgi:hypothetical protein